MGRHRKNCECDRCFQNAVFKAVDRWIEETARKYPGIVCPFCGTNPSKAAPNSSGWKGRCGHEVRKDGLVIGWENKGIFHECITPETTRQLEFIEGKWREVEHE